MERLLVGIDGSATSLDALRWSADLAQRAMLELLAARVFVPTQAELPPDFDRALHDEQRRELELWCTPLPDVAPPKDMMLLDGDPAEALLAAAAAQRADLLVVGGRGAGGFTHLHLGSVAHHLAHHTAVPLAIVSPSGALPVRHLVVGVDGSSGSLGAVRLVADLAKALDVNVTAVSAFEPIPERLTEPDPATWRNQAEADVRQWTAAIEDAGVSLDVDVDPNSHPVAAIARVLEARPGATAVVGTRGRGGFSGLRLGRVPLQLVHHTGAPVILVPAAQS